jgi:hypothetical protein
MIQAWHAIDDVVVIVRWLVVNYCICLDDEVSQPR